MDTKLWQQRLMEVCLRQLREEVAQAPIFQLGDGTPWCAVHNCSAYECECATKYYLPEYDEKWEDIALDDPISKLYTEDDDRSIEIESIEWKYDDHGHYPVNRCP